MELHEKGNLKPCRLDAKSSDSSDTEYHLIQSHLSNASKLFGKGNKTAIDLDKAKAVYKQQQTATKIPISKEKIP